ncbi:MAG: hypothetical protein NTX82_03025 [Candidatus Parcubacteria bacterium]|nr:hypothetical protein [Candidatus Parcubacteria bacterium]
MFRNSFESGPDNISKLTKKKERYEDASSVIELNFFRHGDKETDKSKSDLEIELTKAGGKEAAAKSKTKNMGQSLAFGSAKNRAQQTAGLVMAGSSECITGEESLAELKKILGQELKVGSKIGIDKHLDYVIDMKRPYDQQVMAAFRKGEILPFLFNDSDRLAKAEDIKEGFTYSGMAREIALIVDKYLKVAPRWDKLVADDKNKYTKIMERYLGSHQGITEMFLAKVIELIKGVEERNLFQIALNNEGFGFVEGYQVQIINKAGEKSKVYVFYKKEDDGKIVYQFNQEITPQILDQIIKGK